MLSDIGKDFFDYTCSSLSEKRYIDIEGQELKLIKKIRLSDDKTQIIKNSLQTVQFKPSLDFFVPTFTDIKENDSEIKKSFVEEKKKKKPIYAIEFYKKYKDKTVKAVKIHLRKEKILRLKTLFIPKK